MGHLPNTWTKLLGIAPVGWCLLQKRIPSLASLAIFGEGPACRSTCVHWFAFFPVCPKSRVPPPHSLNLASAGGWTGILCRLWLQCSQMPTGLRRVVRAVFSSLCVYVCVCMCDCSRHSVRPRRFSGSLVDVFVGCVSVALGYGDQR